MTDSLKFGPEWLRNLSQPSDGSIGVVGGGGGQMSTMSAPLRYMLAEHRYGREEMLALYNNKARAPEALQGFPMLLADKWQPPLALVQMTEEETRMWQRGINSDAVLRQMGKLGPITNARERGRGGATVVTGGMDRGRGRGRSSGNYYPRGLSYEEESSRESVGIPINTYASRGRYERSQSGQDRVWGDRNGSENTEWNGSTSPRKDFLGRSAMDNWRSRGATEEEGGGWKTSGHPNRNSWRESFSEKEVENSDPETGRAVLRPPWENRDRSEVKGKWSEENRSGLPRRSNDDVDHLPEWAMANPIESGGSFDATGAFHGGTISDDEDDTIYAWGDKSLPSRLIVDPEELKIIRKKESQFRAEFAEREARHRQELILKAKGPPPTETSTFPMEETCVTGGANFESIVFPNSMRHKELEKEKRLAKEAVYQAKATEGSKNENDQSGRIVTFISPQETTKKGIEKPREVATTISTVAKEAEKASSRRISTNTTPETNDIDEKHKLIPSCNQYIGELNAEVRKWKDELKHIECWKKEAAAGGPKPIPIPGKPNNEVLRDDSGSAATITERFGRSEWLRILNAEEKLSLVVEYEGIVRKQIEIALAKCEEVKEKGFVPNIYKFHPELVALKDKPKSLRFEDLIIGALLGNRKKLDEIGIIINQDPHDLTEEELTRLKAVFKECWNEENHKKIMAALGPESYYKRSISTGRSISLEEVSAGIKNGKFPYNALTPEERQRYIPRQPPNQKQEEDVDLMMNADAALGPASYYGRSISAEEVSAGIKIGKYPYNALTPEERQRYIPRQPPNQKQEEDMDLMMNADAALGPESVRPRTVISPRIAAAIKNGTLHPGNVLTPEERQRYIPKQPPNQKQEEDMDLMMNADAALGPESVRPRTVISPRIAAAIKNGTLHPGNVLTPEERQRYIPRQTPNPKQEEDMDLMMNADALVAKLTDEDERPHGQMNNEKWYYRDPQGDVQGPFSSQQMWEWFTSGYFDKALEIKREGDPGFCHLGDVMTFWGSVPFTNDLQPANKMKGFDMESMCPPMPPIPVPIPMPGQPIVAQASPVTPIAPVETDMYGLPTMIRPNHQQNPPTSQQMPVHASLDQLTQNEQQWPNNVSLLEQQGVLGQINFDTPLPKAATNEAVSAFINQVYQKNQQHQVDSVWGAAPLPQAQVPQQQTHQYPWTSGANNVPSHGAPPPGQLPASLWAIQPMTPIQPKNMKTEQQVLEEQLKAEKERKAQEDERKALLKAARIQADKIKHENAMKRIKKYEEAKRREADALVEEQKKMEAIRRAVEMQKAIAVGQEKARQKVDYLRLAEIERADMDAEKLQMEKKAKEAEEKAKKREEEALRAKHEKALLEEKERDLKLRLSREKHEQQQQQQQQQMIQQQRESMMKQQLIAQAQQRAKAAPPAPWTQNASVTRSASTSLIEIQKLQERERRELAKLMKKEVEMLGKLQNIAEQKSAAYQMLFTCEEELLSNNKMEKEQLIAVEASAQKKAEREAAAAAAYNQQQMQLKWADRSQRPQTPIKPLAEIQAEEQRQLAKQARAKTETSPPSAPAASAGIWNSASQSLTWSQARVLNSQPTSVWAAAAAAHAQKVNATAMPAPASTPSIWGAPSEGAAGLWEDIPMPPTKTVIKKASTSSKTKTAEGASGSAAASALATSNSKSKSSKSRAKKEEQQVMKLFEQKSQFTDEFTTWCVQTLSGLQSTVDIPTFVGFLKDIESPYEVMDYVKSYLGDGREARSFSNSFLQRRSKWRNSQKVVRADDDMCKPAPAVNPMSNDFQEVKGKAKKVKKNKMFRVDNDILGFSVTAAQDRINVGDRDYGEGI